MVRLDGATKTFAVIPPGSAEYAQARARRVPVSPEVAAAIDARSRAAAALPTPFAAIAEQDLPDGALAWVVRPAGRTAPILLFARSSFSMRVWNVASAAMMDDEFAHLEPTQERVLVIEAVDRWRNPEGEVRPIAAFEPQGEGRQSAQTEALKIRQRLERGRPTVVRGVAARIREVGR